MFLDAPYLWGPAVFALAALLREAVAHAVTAGHFRSPFVRSVEPFRLSLMYPVNLIPDY
jgi:hypothetical protein